MGKSQERYTVACLLVFIHEGVFRERGGKEKKKKAQTIFASPGLSSWPAAQLNCPASAEAGTETAPPPGRFKRQVDL